MWICRCIATVISVVLVASAFAQPVHVEAGVEAVMAIRQRLMATFHRPGAALQLDPIVAVGDVAVAGWTQGGEGGRALLRLTGGRWSIVLCSGDALREPATLEHAGVSPEAARAVVAG
jgi:hypothetical protein